MNSHNNKKKYCKTVEIQVKHCIKALKMDRTAPSTPPPTVRLTCPNAPERRAGPVRRTRSPQLDIEDDSLQHEIDSVARKLDFSKESEKEPIS